MRKIIVHQHITLDGIIQAPGGPQEDTTNHFRFGGWIAPFSDAHLQKILFQQMNSAFDLLVGRKTFEIWESFWPNHGDLWPNINSAHKYVASNTRLTSSWQPSHFIGGDVVTSIQHLKQQAGPAIHVWGSSVLMQTLMQHDLVDEFRLFVYPITLGQGKRLFGTGTLPATFRMVGSYSSACGVIYLHLERKGAVETGTAGKE